MEKKNIDWSNLGFGYIQTDYRYVSNYKNGAWDEGGITTDSNIVLNECAGVLQYAQTVIEGLKATLQRMDVLNGNNPHPKALIFKVFWDFKTFKNGV